MLRAKTMEPSSASLFLY